MRVKPNSTSAFTLTIKTIRAWALLALTGVASQVPGIGGSVLMSEFEDRDGNIVPLGARTIHRMDGMTAHELRARERDEWMGERDPEVELEDEIEVEG